MKKCLTCKEDILSSASKYCSTTCRINNPASKAKKKEENKFHNREARRIRNLAIERWIDEFVSGPDCECKTHSYKWRRENPCDKCNEVSKAIKPRGERVREIMQEIKVKERNEREQAFVDSVNGLI